MGIGDKVYVTDVRGDKIGKIVDIKNGYYFVEFDTSDDRECFLEHEIYPAME